MLLFRVCSPDGLADIPLLKQSCLNSPTVREVAMVLVCTRCDAASSVPFFRYFAFFAAAFWLLKVFGG